VNSFKVISEITDIQIIAIGSAIRDLVRLRKIYGPGRWRKVKGTAMIRLRTGRVRRAEIHWYEAHGNWQERIKAQTLFRLKQ
jgi:hypothetical protein